VIHEVVFVEILDLLILAAGRGSRMGEVVPKQFVPLGGQPMIVYCLKVFESLPYIGTKYIVCSQDEMTRMNEILLEYRLSKFVLVKGGEVRAESVRNGLDQVRSERLITHNAVLPFVTKRLVDQVVAENYDCVTTATPLEYNLCEGEAFGERIVPRTRLKFINTPQSFRTRVFRECHERARRDGYIPQSDCELMLHYGHTVRFVPGTTANNKITTRADLLMAEMMLRNLGLWSEHGCDTPGEKE
jgi:2-C-methyl-D-erythritol 4-phosphate cytidylyltransferase